MEIEHTSECLCYQKEFDVSDGGCICDFEKRLYDKINNQETLIDKLKCMAACRSDRIKELEDAILRHRDTLSPKPNYFVPIGRDTDRANEELYAILEIDNGR